MPFPQMGSTCSHPAQGPATHLPLRVHTPVNTNTHVLLCLTPTDPTHTWHAHPHLGTRGAVDVLRRLYLWLLWSEPRLGAAFPGPSQARPSLLGDLELGLLVLLALAWA